MPLFNFTINLLIVACVICYLHHLIFRFLQLLNDLKEPAPALVILLSNCQLNSCNSCGTGRCSCRSPVCP